MQAKKLELREVASCLTRVSVLWLRPGSLSPELLPRSPGWFLFPFVFWHPGMECGKTVHMNFYLPMPVSDVSIDAEDEICPFMSL